MEEGLYSALKQKVILSVDDDAMNQLVIEKTLEPTGVQLVPVKNGAAAVRKLMEGFKPDLILMDLQMPVMGGVEACNIIRKWIDPNIPIIINSGGIDDLDRQKLHSLGIKHFLQKPYNLSDIYQKLAKSLSLVEH